MDQLKLYTRNMRATVKPDRASSEASLKSRLRVSYFAEDRKPRTKMAFFSRRSSLGFSSSEAHIFLFFSFECASFSLFCEICLKYFAKFFAQWICLVCFKYIPITIQKY